MEKTLEIQIAEVREEIALKIEDACRHYLCSRVASAVCSCAMAAAIARGVAR